MILAIDIGTSNFKAALLDYGGAWIRGHSVPLPLSGDGREADSAAWLSAFERAADALAPLSGVEALLVSGNGPTLVPVTGEPELSGGRLRLPSAPALTWLDRRAGEEGRAVSEIMGAFVDPGFFLPKMLFVKNRDPALYGRVRRFLAAPEFLVYALTGEARSVFPSEGFDRWYWNDEALARAGIDREKVPPFVSPGDEIGRISAAVARRFGFSPGTRVFAGGPDFFVSILGSGVARPGQICDRSGSSEGVNLCTRERIEDPRLMSYGHPVRGFWNLSGIISTTGMAVSWAREFLGLQNEDYAAFFALAERAKPGAGGLLFLPYLSGERAPLWDPDARGVFLGLSLSTGRAEAARAVLEGIAFAIRDVLETMAEHGLPAEEIRVSGGTSESPVLNRIKADITGLPVLVPAQREAESAGLAVIGATSLGKYPNFAEAAGQIVRVGQRLEPGAAPAALYEAEFRRYRETYARLKGGGEGVRQSLFPGGSPAP